MNTDITRNWGYLTARKVLAAWPHPFEQTYCGGLIQSWAGSMDSCRRSKLPSVRADRLRAAAEYRREIQLNKGI